MARSNPPSPVCLSAVERGLVLDALKDALFELESPDIAELVSQRLITKIEKAIKVLSAG